VTKLEQYIEQGLVGKSEKTVKTYETQLRKFNDYLVGSGTSLDEPLTRVDVQQYITHLTNCGHKPSSINLAFNAIRGFAKWSGQQSAVQNIRVVKQTPVLQRTPKSLERNERNRLLRLVEQSGNKRDIAIVTMLMYCGLRVGELVALNVGDVELKRGGVVRINAGKGNKERFVPVPAEVRNRLQEYLVTRGVVTAGDPLFISNQRRRISVRTVEHMLKKLGDEFHPHVLRHTFVRGLLDKGADLVTVAKLAGHTDLNVTRSYATPSLQDMADAMERLYAD
jgi:integrase/recombinase XerD